MRVLVYSHSNQPVKVGDELQASVGTAGSTETLYVTSMREDSGRVFAASVDGSIKRTLLPIQIGAEWIDVAVLASADANEIAVEEVPLPPEVLDLLRPEFKAPADLVGRLVALVRKRSAQKTGAGSTSPAPARLDAERAATPLTRIVQHVPVGAAMVGPGVPLVKPEYEDERGRRTPLADQPEHDATDAQEAEAARQLASYLADLDVVKEGESVAAAALRLLKKRGDTVREFAMRLFAEYPVATTVSAATAARKRALQDALVALDALPYTANDPSHGFRLGLEQGGEIGAIEALEWAATSTAAAPALPALRRYYAVRFAGMVPSEPTCAETQLRSALAAMVADDTGDVTREFREKALITLTSTYGGKATVEDADDVVEYLREHFGPDLPPRSWCEMFEKVTRRATSYAGGDLPHSIMAGLIDAFIDTSLTSPDLPFKEDSAQPYREVTSRPHDSEASQELYLLFLWGGVEISVDGPFATEADRMAEARRFCKEEANPSNCDNVFQLSVTAGGPSVAAYMSGSLGKDEDEDEGEHDNEGEDDDET